MRYRKLDAEGDYAFGQSNNFHVNSSAAVAQAITTRLQLFTGEWFLDLAEGTDYAGLILGHSTQGSRDQEIKSRVLSTPDVLEILAYSSSVSVRSFTVTIQVSTTYSATTTITTTLGQ